jgi:ribosomal protein L11 methylase PrmA
MVTGSGILALAALKLGAATAVATDTDPLAVSGSRPSPVGSSVHVL